MRLAALQSVARELQGFLPGLKRFIHWRKLAHPLLRVAKQPEVDLATTLA
jgi:hypothetical protein